MQLEKLYIITTCWTALRLPFLSLWMFYFYCLALIALKFTDTKIATGTSPVVQWIMSVKITGWSSEYTNRMCYGDTWGSSSLGIFLLAAPVGRFIIEGLRVENQCRRGSSQCGRGTQRVTRRQVCFYMFSFLPFKKQGDLQVAYWGNPVHKATCRELQRHVWRVMWSQGADRC